MLKIPIFTACQTNRDDLGNQTPDASNIGGSYRILQLASKLVFLINKSEERIAKDGFQNGNQQLIIKYQRNGASDCDPINVMFQKEIIKMSEVQEGEEVYALDKIIQNTDIEKLLEYYGFEISNREGVILRGKCKIHGGDNPTAFVINRETTMWYCHTGDCGGGDVFELVQKMNNINFPQAVEWLSSFFNVDITGLEIIERKSELKKELDIFIKTMKGKKKKVLDEYIVEEEILPVKKFRQFKEETLDFFKLGYVNKITLDKRGGGEYTLYKRLLFPIIYKNKMVGIALRRTRSSDVPKWSNQPLNIDTGEILYNYDETSGKANIVVVEGITDVWAYHEIGITAVATFGAHITDKQYKLLMKTGADLTFSFDGDKAGREATKKSVELFKNKANIYIVDMPEGSDPEGLKREELLELYEKRQKSY